MVRMPKLRAELWHALLCSCCDANSKATAATAAVVANPPPAAKPTTAAKPRNRRVSMAKMHCRRRRSSAVNHAVAARRASVGQGKARSRQESMRLFPSDRRSLHMSVKYNVEWECDANDNRCSVCTKRFMLLRRRHHCRQCGNLVCNACSRNRLATKYSGTRERACDECVKAKYRPPVAAAANSPPSPVPAPTPATKRAAAFSPNPTKGATTTPAIVRLVQHYEVRVSFLTLRSGVAAVAGKGEAFRGVSVRV